MAKITVHGFTVPQIRSGELEVAKGKATAEKIKELYGEIIPNTEEIIDDSKLNKNGRYHPPSKN